MERRPFSTGTLVWLGILAMVLNVAVFGVWTALLLANVRTTPAIPWAVLGMAIILSLLWQYLNGRWAPAKTSEARHYLMRAKPLPRNIFRWALLAGSCGIVSLTGLWIVFADLTKIPGNASLQGLGSYPRLAALLFLIMASMVSAVVEETTLRGYFQAGLETRISIPIAVMLPVMLSFPLHGSTQGFALSTFVFYLDLLRRIESP